MAYLAAGNLEGALLEYKACNQWSMTLSLAGLPLPLPVPSSGACLGSPRVLWLIGKECYLLLHPQWVYFIVLQYFSGLQLQHPGLCDVISLLCIFACGISFQKDAISDCILKDGPAVAHFH